MIGMVSEEWCALALGREQVGATKWSLPLGMVRAWEGVSTSWAFALPVGGVAIA